jgi:S1-C subfamily serine protease
MTGATRELLLQLQSILADLYPTNDQALEMADRAGLSVGTLKQSSIPKSTWWSILKSANGLSGKLCALIKLAREEYPEHEGLRLAEQGKLNDVSGPEVRWAPQPTLNHEVIIGASDLLPAQFLLIGAKMASSVVRVNLGAGRFGSGFLVAKDLVLTNNHVLPDEATASTAVIETGYEDTLEGISVQGVAHQTRPAELFKTNVEDDWAIVKIVPSDACVPLMPRPTATTTPGARVYIIQHPGGGPKQVSLGDNTVTAVTDKRLQYLTDTRPGASGSPVFDEKWRLVGIHHSGGWLSEPNSKQQMFRNEGIAIGAVLAGLKAVGVNL